MRILYVSGRPIDSRDIFAPLAQAIFETCPAIERVALSPYQWLFPDAPPDMNLEQMGIPTIHRFGNTRDGNVPSFQEAFRSCVSNWRPSLVVCPIDQPGIYQKVVDWCKVEGIKTLIINESPLTLIQTGVDQFVTRLESRGYFSTPSAPSLRSALRELFASAKLVARTIKRDLAQNNNRTQPPVRYRGQSGADVIAVVGEYDKQLLTRLGVPVTNIRVIGWLRSDQLIAEHTYSRKDVLQKLNFQDNARYVLLVSQSFDYGGVPTSCNDYLELAYAAALIKEHRPSWRFVLTVHPDVDVAHVRKTLRDGSVSVHLELVKGFPDRLALNEHADLVVGFYSTALFEAMIAGRLIITLDYVPLQLYYPFNAEYGAVAPVFHRFELPNQIRRVLMDSDYVERIRQNQRTLLADVLNSPDGMVRYRAAQVLAEVLGIRDCKEKR